MLYKSIKGDWHYLFNHDCLTYEVYSGRQLIACLNAEDSNSDYPIKENIAEMISILPDLISFFNATIEFLNNKEQKKVVDTLFKLTDIRSQIYDKIGLLRCGCALRCVCGEKCED